MPESRFYGAALAAMAVPAKDHGRPEAQELVAYLHREQAAQPLHNRLMLLWASTAFPEALPAAARRAIVDEVWKKQQADGSWTMDALGPFQAHAKAPRARGRQRLRHRLRRLRDAAGRGRSRRTPNLPVLSPGCAPTRTRNAAAGRPSP